MARDRPGQTAVIVKCKTLVGAASRPFSWEEDAGAIPRTLGPAPAPPGRTRSREKAAKCRSCTRQPLLLLPQRDEVPAAAPLPPLCSPQPSVGSAQCHWLSERFPAPRALRGQCGAAGAFPDAAQAGLRGCPCTPPPARYSFDPACTGLPEGRRDVERCGIASSFHSREYF